MDRYSLSLSGDQNQLIDEVAHTNRRTIVVLNTGGPVLMPWLGRVSSVIEAWYPGQQFGPAIAAAGTDEPAIPLPGRERRRKLRRGARRRLPLV